MSDTVEFDVESVKVETELALLLVIDGEEYWVPKSQVDDDSEVYLKEHGEGVLVVTRWWARKHGLVDDE